MGMGSKPLAVSEEAPPTRAAWASEAFSLVYFLSLQSHFWIFPGLLGFHYLQRSDLNLLCVQLKFLFLQFLRNVIFTG